MSAQTTTPERTLEQRAEALRRANEIRSLRGQIKRDLKARRATLVAVIADPPEWLLTMKVFDLLVAAPRFGPARASEVMNRTRTSPAKSIGGLTERQRTEIVERLRVWS